MTSVAQDIHFSQINFSPLTLNPALAGANYDLQANLNYRSQWSSVGAPFQTIASSVDGRLNAGNRNDNFHIAAGLNFFNDQAGASRVSTNNIGLTLAAHVVLAENHSIGAGAYVGMLQRSIGNISGKWASQYNGSFYDPTIASGENINNTAFSTIDAGGGLVYTYSDVDSYISSNNSKQVNAGIAAYHVNRPNFSFINHPNERLAMRFTGFVNGSFGLPNTNLLIEPGIYFNYQGGAREFYAGSFARYILKGNSVVTGFIKKSSFALGVFYRNRDALVTKAHFEWNGLAFGVSYDFNISKLASATSLQGGMEFSLRYVMGDLYFSHKSKIFRKRKF